MPDSPGFPSRRSMSTSFSLHPAGPFSLAAASRFGRGFTPSPTAGDEDEMRLAFPCEDADWQSVGVRLTQRAGAVVGEVTIANDADGRVVEAIGEQCRRILSLDIDAAGFPEVGRRDEVVRVLQERYPGLRPVLFQSPYEAAAWAIIGQRIRITQAAAIKARISEALGERLTVGGVSMTAFPAPARLTALRAIPGLTDRKVERLQALAQAALSGDLHPTALRAGSHDERLAKLQVLPGIGPFSAELILVRGAGEPDHFPEHERRLQQAIRRAYALPDHTGIDELRELAEAWRPFRSWVSVLLRTWLEDETGDVRRGRPAALRPMPLRL